MTSATIANHAPDARTLPADATEIKPLTLSFQPLTPAEALQDPGFSGPACQPLAKEPGSSPNRQNALPQREKTSINLGDHYAAYFGTLHSHTGQSDAEGTTEAAYAQARDVAHLDFFAITDHPEYWLFREKDHYEQQKQIAAASERPGFVPFLGFEYSSMMFGHFVVLNSEGVHNAFEDLTLGGFYDWLKRPEQANVLVVFAHPGFHDYRFDSEFDHFAFDKALAAKMIGVEVIHWNEYQRYLKGYDGVIPFIDEAIRKGWRVGAVSSQDVHAANWGTRDPTRLALLLPHLDRQSILEALKARRFYATANKDLQFAVNIERRDQGWAPMGSWLTPADLPKDSATVKVRYYDHDCADEPRKMEAVLDGNVVATYEFPPLKSGASDFPAAGEFTMTLPLNDAYLPKRFDLYFRFYQGNEMDAFTESSPIIIDMTGAPPP